MANSAGSNGGGLYIDLRPATIENNTIQANAAGNHGGGLYFKQATPAVINGNSIEGNSAGGDGGGLYLNDESRPTISHNTIATNSAADDGGGLYLDDDTPAHISANLIYENAALGDDGGGLMIRDSDAGVINNIFRDNSAQDDGEAILVDQGGSPTIYHNTLAGNSAAAGDGIYTKSSAAPIVANNIIVGYGRAIACAGSINVSRTFIPEAGDIDSDCGASGDDTFDGDPLLDANFHLLPASPAVDNGSDVNVLVDIDGEERPFNITPDIGADEYQP